MIYIQQNAVENVYKKHPISSDVNYVKSGSHVKIQSI